MLDTTNSYLVKGCVSVRNVYGYNDDGLESIRSPMYVLKREPLHLNNIMIREGPYRMPCKVGRGRQLLLLTMFGFSVLFLLIYIHPLKQVDLTIIQGDTTLFSGRERNMKLTTEHRKDNFNAIGSSTGRDTGPTAFKTHTTNSGSLEQSSKRIMSDTKLTISGFDSDILIPSTLTSTSSQKKEQCAKKRDVAFLKVHKAGSTTIMNIFLRFSIQNNLNIVLPAHATGFGFNYLGYGKTVSRQNIVPLPGNETYNILCNHVVYNKLAFQSIMPEDTTYVGIVREPKSQFLSAGAYYGFFKHLDQYGKDHNNSSNVSIISDYLQRPEKYPISKGHIHNGMSFDFGLPTHKIEDRDFVKNYIDVLRTDFALIMVMERFTESLVLMRRALCWDTKDILYVPLNARANKKKVDLSTKDLTHLKQLNSADFKLYDRFYNVFETLVANEGPDFKDEVDRFKAIQLQVENFCRSLLIKRTTSYIQLPFEASKWSPSFVVNIEDCKLMTQPELPMMSHLITTAWTRYNNWKGGLTKNNPSV